MTPGTDLSVPYTNDRFFFLHTFFVPTLELIILSYNMPHIHVSHFVLTSFSDTLVTFVSDQVRRRPLQPILSRGSEQRGQNIRVRTVFLTLTKILDLLLFFHQVCKNNYASSNWKVVLSTHNICDIVRKPDQACCTNEPR